MQAVQLDRSPHHHHEMQARQRHLWQLTSFWRPERASSAASLPRAVLPAGGLALRHGRRLIRGLPSAERDGVAQSCAGAASLHPSDPHHRQLRSRTPHCEHKLTEASPPSASAHVHTSCTGKEKSWHNGCHPSTQCNLGPGASAKGGLTNKCSSPEINPAGWPSLHQCPVLVASFYDWQRHKTKCLQSGGTFRRLPCCSASCAWCPGPRWRQASAPRLAYAAAAVRLAGRPSADRLVARLPFRSR